MLNINQVIQNLTFLVWGKKTGDNTDSSTLVIVSDKVARIKSGTRHYSRGDDGTSEFIKGIRLPKHSPAHLVYSALEFSKWCSSKILVANSKSFFLEEFEEYQLHWFIENLHSLGAFCFNWGSDESLNHIFPIEVLDTIDKRIKYLQTTEINGKSLGDCEDFLSFTDSRLLSLDLARLAFRILETTYSLWHFTLYGLKKMEGARLDTSALLNRTSTYLFWVSRYTTLKLNLEENVWKAKVGSYNPPTFEVKEDDES